MEKDDVVVEEQLVNQDSSEAETSLEANSSNCRQDKVPETDCVLPQSASTLRSSAANAAPSICGLKNMPPNRPILGSRPPIAAGETIPSSLIRYKQRVIDVAEFFRDRTGVVFGVPGQPNICLFDNVILFVLPSRDAQFRLFFRCVLPRVHRIACQRI